ncbi:DUF2239 family protein [bacterium]|nr:DUF2239 family protein [bacterium]
MQQSFTAFCGSQLLSSGNAEAVSTAVAAAQVSNSTEMVLVFDDQSGEQIDMPLPKPPRVDQRRTVRTGRPRLGVVGREVTLLPRHWDWLGRQPGGASVALRKLVEAASKTNKSSAQIREKREATYRFMTTMGGNLPQYEEAIRALFAGKGDRFSECVAGWPDAIREYTLKLAVDTFEKKKVAAKRRS